MKSLAALVLVSACLGAGMAHAAEPAPPPTAAAPASQPSPHALDLTRRYIAALHMKESFRPMMTTMLATMLQQQMAAHPELPEDKRELLRKAVTDAFDDSLQSGMLDKMTDAMAPSMATVFTEDELQALVDFYESPKGQTIVAKMPAFGQQVSVAMGKFLPEFQADLTRRMLTNLQAVDSKSK